jgi:RNA polymerase sigma factor (sigma-70 family)
MPVVLSEIAGQRYGRYMRDAEVAASVVAGDPAGLAEAYDRYADPLYAYCWFMLDHPVDAADAVQDTFLIAVSRLGRLRNPEYLRPWLYAMARNECLRRLRARQAASALDQTASALDQATDVTDATVDIAEDAERAELRALARSAVGGLNPGEREVVELWLGHGLEPAEVALVLGVSRNHAHSLLSRAHDQLQACLGVLLAGRGGRDDCDELNALVAESTRLAGGAPAALREHVLWMAAGQDSDALAHQADLRSRVRAFGRRGFPKPLSMPKSGWHRSPQGQAAMAAGVAAAVVAAVVTLALTGNWLPAPAADPHPASNASAQPTTPAAAVPVAAQRTSTPHASASAKAAKAPVLAATQPPARPTAKHPAPASPSATPPAGHPTTPAPPSPTGTPAPSAPPPSATPTAPQPPTAPGTLVVSADWLDLTPFQPSGTITLTAENGPVTWGISQTDGPAGALVISPAGGSLAEGQSVQVTVAAESATTRLYAELTISPGGQTVTVEYRAGHGSY